MTLRLATVSDGAAPLTSSKGVALTPVDEARRLGRLFSEEAAARDLERRLPHAEVAALKASGLLAGRIPVEEGGLGLSWLETARVVVEIARGDPNIAQSIQPHLTILDLIRSDAGPQLRRSVFSAVAAGGLIANGAAERGGRFFGDIATRIRESHDGYLLDGVKYYSTGSLYADLLFITALDEDDAAVALIFPRDRAGATILDDWNGFGQRTSASGTIELAAVTINEDEIIRSPRAFDRRWHQQAAAQLIHVAIDTGIALAALDDAILLARSRGRPLRESGVAQSVDDPYVQQTIAALSVAAHGAQALMERAGRFVDIAADAHFAGGATEADFIAASIAVAEAKIASTTAALDNSEKLFQVANASGTDRLLGLDRHWRNARTHTTHDPLSYKFKFIGDWLLNGRAPPTTVKI